MAERPVVIDTSIPSIPKVASHPRRPANILGTTAKNLYSDYMYVNVVYSKSIRDRVFNVVRICNNPWGVVFSVYRLNYLAVVLTLRISKMLSRVVIY